MGAPSEESRGIHTSDNHNSLYTRASFALPSLATLFLQFRPSCSRLEQSSLSLLFFLRLFSSLLCRVASSSLVPRSSCRVDHGYSAIVFDLSCSCCGCRLPEDFTCLPLPRTLPGFLCSFSFPLLFIVRLFLPFAVWHPGWYLFLEPSHPPHDTFFLPRLFPFILEMGVGIHETKLMITTSKQRPTATLPCHLYIPPSPSHPSFTIFLSRFLSYLFLSLFLSLFFSVSFVLFLRCSSVISSTADLFSCEYCRIFRLLIFTQRRTASTCIFTRGYILFARLDLFYRSFVPQAEADTICGRWPRLPVEIIVFTACCLSHFRVPILPPRLLELSA